MKTKLLYLIVMWEKVKRMFPLGLSAAREQSAGQLAVSAVAHCSAAQKACSWMGFEQPETRAVYKWVICPFM